jgi:alcohol dehydrogenase
VLEKKAATHVREEAGMSTYTVAQVMSAGGPLEIAEREVPEPGPGHVRIAVEACGICHSDSLFVDGAVPGIRFPVVAGHEIAGRIEQLGARAEEYGWQVGDRVTVGWFGGSCLHCTPCRQGDFIVCVNLKVPGWTYDGGFAQQVIAPVDALARIPDALAASDAGPLACAGVTVFNGLRRSSARPGEADLAKQLGAHHYVDSTAATDVAEALRALGGVKVLVATAGSSEAVSATVDGLTHRGELVVIGVAPEPLDISPAQLITGGRVVRGHPSGTAQDVQETMEFSALNGVRPMTEIVPLEQADEAYRKMLSGAARFRMVLSTG